MYIFKSQITYAYIIIQSMQFPFTSYGMALYINDTVPTKHYHLENLCVCERASLENFRIFTFKTAISFNILLVLQIFCRYK